MLCVADRVWDVQMSLFSSSFLASLRFPIDIGREFVRYLERKIDSEVAFTMLSNVISLMAKMIRT